MPDTRLAAATTLLTFRLGDRLLALPAPRVIEVVRAVALTALPRAPGIIEGVFSLRGVPVPVLDVRQRFGLPPEEPDPSQHFVIARTRRRRVALRVDRAEELVTVTAPQLVAPGEVLPRTDHILGLAVTREGLLVIQDLDAFLNMEEDRQLDACLEAAR